MKSVMNLLSGTVMAGLAESLALSEKLGLDSAQVTQVLEMSPMHCPLIKKLAQGKGGRRCDQFYHSALIQPRPEFSIVMK